MRDNLTTWRRDHTIFGNRFSHDRIGSNSDMIAKKDTANDKRTWTNINIVANSWCSRALTSIGRTNSNALIEITVTTDCYSVIYHDPTIMADIESLAYGRVVGNGNSVPELQTSQPHAAEKIQREAELAALFEKECGPQPERIMKTGQRKICPEKPVVRAAITMQITANQVQIVLVPHDAPPSAAT